MDAWREYRYVCVSQSLTEREMLPGNANRIDGMTANLHISVRNRFCLNSISHEGRYYGSA